MYHIDGMKYNNIDNLRVLCIKCHSKGTGTIAKIQILIVKVAVTILTMISGKLGFFIQALFLIIAAQLLKNNYKEKG